MKRSAVVLIAVGAAVLLFWAVLHQVSAMWLDVALSPELRHSLQQSMEDQKRLRVLDPRHRELYRRRFDETRTLVSRVEVIRMSRARVVRRFELAMLGVLLAAAAAAAVLTWGRGRRAAERERREYAERLATWQTAARRHAHEIRGPLTAARLEAERLAALARSGAPAGDIARAEASVSEELERLATFTREFSSFGALGAPALRPESLASVIEEFRTTFAGAWPGMTVRAEAAIVGNVCADRDLLRQVLVNLCSNAAAAGASTVLLTPRAHAGRVVLDVVDDGSGIPPPLRAHVFDPYVTTRRIGEGMGLGLAISRKIMLDHGGDLELAGTSPRSTAFRLTFGAAECR